MKTIKQIMEENGYVEITKREKQILLADKYLFIETENSKGLYFKKKSEPKFPKVFEDRLTKIEIDAFFQITSKTSHQMVSFAKNEDSILILKEAMKYLEDNQ